MAGVEVFRFMDAPSPLESPKEAVRKLEEYIKASMGPDDKGLLALSGGVDSSVVAELCRRAVPGRVVLFHIDHGFMRRLGGREESRMVCGMFSDYPGFVFREARDLFYRHVFGVEDADEKRAGFREAYSALLREAMRKHGCNVFLDGTIKPDIEEVDAGIKLQHNPGLEDKYGAGKVIEPLAGLVKAEVRAVARELGIPYLRPPFPGPGLAVRTPGAMDLRRLEVEKQADDIVETEFPRYFKEKQGAEMVIGPRGEQKPFQYFAATFIRRGDAKSPGKVRAFGERLAALGIRPGDIRLLGTRVTGKTPEDRRVYDDAVCISGDIEPGMWPGIAGIAGKTPGIARVFLQVGNGPGENKRYDVAIRSVDSTDARTARVSDVSPGFLERVSGRIKEECGDVGSVFFDITPKPPATIEYE
jgi:GMP synthase (glutamine-hydrolysing)